MLRLVYVNPNPIPANTSPPFMNPNTLGATPQRVSWYESVLRRVLPHFTAEARFTSPTFYTLSARDLCHYLSCEISLEIQEGPDDTGFGDVICHFPVINEKFLETLLWEDELLVNRVAEQFYLKVLEQLLQFCATHNAARLVIHVSCPKAPVLEFYKPFVAHTAALTYDAKEVALTIQSDRALYEKLMIYMDKLNREFQHTLQEEKWDNPMAQQYLKLSSFANQAAEHFLSH